MGQDVIINIQKIPHLTKVMDDFLDSKGLKRERSGMPGLLLNGEQWDRLTSESSLRDLFRVLSDAGEKCLGFYTVKFLESCKTLYKVCVRKTLDENFQDALDNFTHYFNILFEAGYLNETPKAHIIMHHFGDMMRESGRSLFLADCQGLESVHSALRKSDTRHGCHITNVQGTALHKEMSVRSVSFYNSRTLGFVLPDHLVPPDPGPDVEDDNNNDVEQLVNEDEERNNERNCETPRGFSGDILENESEASLLSQLEEDLANDNDEEAPINEDEEEMPDDDTCPGVNAAQYSQVDIILNGDGGGPIYSMEELFCHIKDKNLPLRSRDLVVSSDGNCFFESLQDLAEKFNLPVPHDKHLLRHIITDSMKGHPDVLTWVQEFLHGEMKNFEEIVARLSKDRQYTDNYGMTTLTAAHVLGNYENHTLTFRQQALSIELH